MKIYTIGYCILFLILFAAAFYFGKERESSEQEKQKSKKTIRHIPNKWR